MGIVVNLDVIMAKKKMSFNDLSQKVGATTVNLSILKTGKAKGVRGFNCTKPIIATNLPGAHVPYIHTATMQKW